MPIAYGAKAAGTSPEIGSSTARTGSVPRVLPPAATTAELRETKVAEEVKRGHPFETGELRLPERPLQVAIDVATR